MSIKKMIMGIFSLLVGVSSTETYAFRLEADSTGSGTWSWGSATYHMLKDPINADTSYTATSIVYWSTAQVDAKNIQYWINSSGTPDVANENSAVDAGFQVWEDVSTSSVTVENAGTHSNTQSTNDGKNMVFWDPNNSVIPSGFHGLAMITYTESTGLISDVDIVLNDNNRTWKTDGSHDEPNNVLDIQSVIAHEAGHLLGLHHSNIYQATMDNPIEDTGWRTLHEDDQWGISWLYPEAVSAIPKGGQIAVTWNKFSTGATPNYRVLWGTTGLTYTDSANVGNVDNYTITGLTNGTQYYIAVSQRSSTRSGGRSNELSNIPSTCRSNFDNSGSSQNDVDFDDFFLFSDHYGEKYTDGGYEQRFDLNGNRIVVGPDTVIFNGDFGHNCPYPTKPVASSFEGSAISNDGRNPGAKIRLLSLEDNNGLVKIRLTITNVTDLKGYGVSLDYNAEALDFLGIEHRQSSLGNVLANPGNTPIFVGRKDPLEEGTILLGGALPRTAIPAHNGGFLAEVSFRKKATGYKAGDVSIKNAVLLDSQKKRNPTIQDPVSVVTQATSEGSEPHLFQNIPNPFNPSTVISFKIPDSAPLPVSLTVYNMSGQVVRRLLSDTALESGTYSITWDSKDERGVEAAAGVYLYRLEMGEKAIARKLTVIR